MFYLFFKRKSKNKALRVILFYICYCIINESVSFYLQKIHSEYTILLFNLFTLIEYSFYCLFLIKVLHKKTNNTIILSFWVAFILFATIDFFVLSKTHEFDSFTSGIESIIIIFLSIFYLYTQLKGSTNMTIYSTFNFWIIITFLIYFCGTFFLYLFVETMKDSVTFQKQYLIINISFNILKNVLLCVAMTMKLNNNLNQQKSLIPDLDDDLFVHNKINSPD